MLVIPKNQMYSDAGIDSIKKVYDLTEAISDQEHLPISGDC